MGTSPGAADLTSFEQACPGPSEQADLHPITATVAGNQVTLSWPPVPSEAWPRVLLPGAATSVSAPSPAGNYSIALVVGNTCGSWMVGAKTFTVP